MTARRSLRVAVSAAAVVGLAALALTGCVGGSELITQSSASGHILMSDARHAEPVTSDRIEGTLTVVGSCFGLDTGTGSFAAIFPQGSGIIEGTEQVAVPGWGTLGLGNRYQGGGGVMESATLSYHDAIPVECLAARMIVLYPLR
mgnify:CR=1 FL=1